MPRQALFANLIIDENDHPVETAYVGNEPCYVVDDAGFRRHIPSEHVDRQVLQFMKTMIEGHEGILAGQAAKMLGQEDIFSIAMIEKQLKNLDDQFNAVLEMGIPEDTRTYLGMMGFHVRIDVHGNVLEVNQPGITGSDEE